MKVFFLSLTSFFAITSTSYALDAENCNREIAKAIYAQAREKCSQKGASKIERVVWSEKELRVTRKGKGILGGVYFQCTNDREYLAVAEIIVDNCHLSSLSISNTSEVTQSYIGN